MVAIIIFTARQRSYWEGKVFSRACVSFCLSTQRGLNVTITHDAICQSKVLCEPLTLPSPTPSLPPPLPTRSLCSLDCRQAGDWHLTKMPFYDCFYSDAEYCIKMLPFLHNVSTFCLNCFSLFVFSGFLSKI